MLILVRFLKGSRNLFKLRSNFSRSCFDWAYEEFQSTMYEADAEIAGAAVAQVGQVMSLSHWMGFYFDCIPS